MKGAVIVVEANRLFSTEEVSLMEWVEDGTWPHFNSRGIGMRVREEERGRYRIIMLP